MPAPCLLQKIVFLTRPSPSWCPAIEKAAKGSQAAAVLATQLEARIPLHQPPTVLASVVTESSPPETVPLTRGPAPDDQQETDLGGPPATC